MFTVLELCEEALTRVEASGSLSRGDCGRLVVELEQSLANRRGDVCRIELSDFNGVEPGSLLDDLSFDAPRCREVRRCAIVGNRAWSSCISRVAHAIFPEAEVRYFDLSEHDVVQQWLDESAAALAAC
jgi:hypothetical protein